MTLKQQAYGLIDRLPDDSVQIIIQVMRKMIPGDSETVENVTAMPDSVTPKMKAYLRMQELRKETSKYDISETQRKAAMEEKFGAFG